MLRTIKTKIAQEAIVRIWNIIYITYKGLWTKIKLKQNG